MSGESDLTETEQQLLMAAALHGFGPNTDLGRANTARVVNQVLRWRGLSDEQILSGWWDEDCSPAHDAVYSALVRITHQTHRAGPGRPPERPGVALFEGGGNWGVPGDPDRPACWPQFNSCRLTAEGKRIARDLLAQHPEYQKTNLTPSSPARPASEL
jgi:hypothetical protein